MIDYNKFRKVSFYGIPKEDGGDSPKNDAKMEDCVSKVMAKGHDKESAIRICKHSLGFTKRHGAAAGPSSAVAPPVTITPTTSPTAQSMAILHPDADTPGIVEPVPHVIFDPVTGRKIIKKATEEDILPVPCAHCGGPMSASTAQYAHSADQKLMVPWLSGGVRRVKQFMMRHTGNRKGWGALEHHACNNDKNALMQQLMDENSSPELVEHVKGQLENWYGERSDVVHPFATACSCGYDGSPEMDEQVAPGHKHEGNWPPSTPEGRGRAYRGGGVPVTLGEMARHGVASALKVKARMLALRNQGVPEEEIIAQHSTKVFRSEEDVKAERDSVSSTQSGRLRKEDQDSLAGPSMIQAFQEASQVKTSKDYSEETREEYTEKGGKGEHWALPDGSFPIKDCGDVKDAVHRIGSTNKDKDMVKRHILKRWKALDCGGSVPFSSGREASVNVETDHISEIGPVQPVKFIDDHEGLLAMGINPATCERCSAPMELHNRWETNKQSDAGVVEPQSMAPEHNFNMISSHLQEEHDFNKFGSYSGPDDDALIEIAYTTHENFHKEAGNPITAWNDFWKDRGADLYDLGQNMSAPPVPIDLDRNLNKPDSIQGIGINTPPVFTSMRYYDIDPKSEEGRSIQNLYRVENSEEYDRALFRARQKALGVGEKDLPKSIGRPGQSKPHGGVGGHGAGSDGLSGRELHDDSAPEHSKSKPVIKRKIRDAVEKAVTEVVNNIIDVGEKDKEKDKHKGREGSVQHEAAGLNLDLIHLSEQSPNGAVDVWNAFQQSPEQDINAFAKKEHEEAHDYYKNVKDPESPEPKPDEIGHKDHVIEEHVGSIREAHGRDRHDVEHQVYIDRGHITDGRTGEKSDSVDCSCGWRYSNTYSNTPIEEIAQRHLDNPEDHGASNIGFSIGTDWEQDVIARETSHDADVSNRLLEGILPGRASDLTRALGIPKKIQGELYIPPGDSE